MIRVADASVVETGVDSQRHPVGTVTVHFEILCAGQRSQRTVEFEDVDLNDFKTWQEGDWNDHDVPWDMTMRGNFWAVVHQLDRQGQLEQEDLEAELWDFYDDVDLEHSGLQAGDVLGHVTDTRSPGFGPTQDESLFLITDVVKEEGE